VPGREDQPVTLDFEDRSAAEEGAEPGPPAGNGSGEAESAGTRRVRVLGGVRRLIDAIARSDDEAVERAVMQLSERSRWLAPLALIVGAFLMLFQGLKLLVTNWRLTLVQILPAMWIWIAMLDIKIHVLHGKGFNTLYGSFLALASLGVIAATAGSFYLNGVFAFAIVDRGEPQIRPAFAKANAHLRVIMAWGCGIGLALAFSALVVQRWGLWWFAVSQSIVVGIMMLCYLAVPARIVGIDTKKGRSRRDKLAATAVGGAMGAVICSPPYTLGRLGILMLGWHGVFWLGVIFIVIGVLLQTGVTSAVKAVKFSAKLIGDPSGVVEADPAGE
jgi:MFS family permease